MKPDAQQRLVANIVESLSAAKPEIQMRQLCYFFPADPNCGRLVAESLGIAIDPSVMPAAGQPVRV
jgi:catalase